MKAKFFVNLILKNIRSDRDVVSMTDNDAGHLRVTFSEPFEQDLYRYDINDDSPLLPKLYALRCFDNDSRELFQSWSFYDYLEYCDTVSHVLASDAVAPMKGCTLQSVAVFSGGFELVIWEKRYD